VREILTKILEGKVMWGAASMNDMKGIGFKSNLPCEVLDIQDFFRDRKNQPISLSRLSEHFLGENMQSGKHSSIVDARITAICVRRMKKFQELGFVRFQCQKFDTQPNPRQKKGNPGWDTRCTCGLVNQTAKKKTLGTSRFDAVENFNIEEWE
jgi:hypothetical protein